MKFIILALSICASVGWAADSDEDFLKGADRSTAAEPQKPEAPKVEAAKVEEPPIKQTPAIIMPPQPKTKSQRRAAPAPTSDIGAAINAPPAGSVGEATTSQPPQVDIFSSLDYPELQVVPRATERLTMEAQIEGDKIWLSLWPINLSALATIYTGFMLNGEHDPSDGAEQRKRADLRSQSAMMVGGVWLGLTTYYVWTKPYTTELKKIKTLGGRDRRGELLRERMAEEALERPARMVRIFTWAAFLTNFAANALMYGQTTTKLNIYVLGGMAFSAMPLLFSNRYIDNYDKHLEYKRKIYAPLVGVDFYRPTMTAKLEPRMVLQWQF